MSPLKLAFFNMVFVTHTLAHRCEKFLLFPRLQSCLFLLFSQMRACHMEHEDTIQFLCEKGSTALRIKNSTGQTCMDLASQSLNPLIANLLEKKYLESLESSSSDELQFGGRKRVNYNTNYSNKIVENLPFSPVLLRDKPNSTKNQEKRIFVNQTETEESLGCKYHCQQDKSYSRYVASH